MTTENKAMCENCGCVDEELFELNIGGETKLVCADCAKSNGYRRCDDCGEWIAEDDGYTTQDGDFICESCRDNDYTYCDNCEEIVPVDDVFDINPGFYRDRDRRCFCKSCRDDNAYRCDDCGEYFTEGNIHEDSRHTVCDHCYEDHWYTCYECGALVRDDDVCWYNGEAYCSDCVPDEDSYNFHDYSYKPDPEFQFRAGELSKLTKDNGFTVSSYEARKYLPTFGVELEVDKGDDHCRLSDELAELNQPIYMKHDGSLGDEGVEIVTHPCSLAFHQYELRWAEIARVCKANNYKSHDARTCGLHIHVGLASLGSGYREQRVVKAKLVLLACRFQSQLTTFSRRGTDELNHWAAFPNVSDITEDMGEGDLQNIALGTECAGRYQAVNLCPENTVEFRLFRGTLKRDTILASLQLVSNLVKYAMSHTLHECAFEASWLDVLNAEQFKELNTYAAKRGLM